MDYSAIGGMSSVKDSPKSATSSEGDDMADMPDDSGLPPHLRELASGFGFSPSQGAALREFLHAVLAESESPELDDDAELGMMGM